MPGHNRVRFAVVGQGYFAQSAILPAFKNAKNAELVALVGGDADKLAKLGRTYGVETLVSYDEYGSLVASGEIDAVYIATPNSLHREHTVIAAEHGVHVLVEKPMATTEEDCRAMINACRVGGVKLMVGYRLHFEAANLDALRMVDDGKLGNLRLFASLFTMQVKKDNIRVRWQTGGGPLWDIGVYCINAARSIFRAEPNEVFAYSASTDDPRFEEVHEQVAATLRFPGERLATFAVSFGGADTGAYDIVGTDGTLRLDPAFDNVDEMTLKATIRGKERSKTYPKRDQVAPEIRYFADCILQHREPEPAGDEGLADVRVVLALMRSAETRRPVRLGEPMEVEHPHPDQEATVAGHDEPELVGVESPSEH
jgi:predicted dehydrogenase